MRQTVITLAGGMFPATLAAQDIAVPSGKTITFLDMIRDQPGTDQTYRFRFVSPDISRAEAQADYASVERDMAHLCQTVAMPRVSEMIPGPSQIVISISDRPTEFGVPSPEATQIFETYSPSDGQCIWEPF